MVRCDEQRSRGGIRRCPCWVTRSGSSASDTLGVACRNLGTSQGCSTESSAYSMKAPRTSTGEDWGFLFSAVCNDPAFYETTRLCTAMATRTRSVTAFSFLHEEAYARVAYYHARTAEESGFAQ